MPKIFHISLYLLLLVTTLLSVSSYSHHSSIGIDHDFDRQGERILHKYFRVNWTGYGSILIGYGSQWRQYDLERPLEKFDPASSLLKAAEIPAVRQSIWNKIGFWFINSNNPSPTFWVGIPSWLPVLFLAFILFVSRREPG